MASIQIDDKSIDFQPGQSIIQAASNAGVYIPHLCYHPEFTAHGSCRVCMVEVNGRQVSACTTEAQDGMQISHMSDDLQQTRKQVLEMLFAEGNHVCPSCEKSGACTLQSVAEYCGMLTAEFTFQYPQREIDASHEDFILDKNRCINCELCVRASRDIDGKSVFAIAGRGGQAQLIVNAVDGQLGSTDFSVQDRAASVCPVGSILPKHYGFATPIGQRSFDLKPIEQQQVSGHEG